MCKLFGGISLVYHENAAMAPGNDGGSNPASDAAKAVAVGTVTGAVVTGATAAGATSALGAVGFSSTGVVAGSIAAGIQSSVGFLLQNAGNST